jgi:hypothetical protein
MKERAWSSGFSLYALLAKNRLKPELHAMLFPSSFKSSASFIFKRKAA